MNSKEPQPPLFAVYGTLRNGFGNHHILNNTFCEFLGLFITKPEFKMVSLGGFPGVIIDAPKEQLNQSIITEIYQVNHTAIEERLDRLEGYPEFYQKTKIKTPWGEAYMYILSEKKYGKFPIVTSGDWKTREKI